ncbi:MAG TPA: hypothetical protein DCX07_14570 [Phycisphaerales bacterium]|nr:hypothetical protein [Phycisphaerales bacterium]
MHVRRAIWLLAVAGAALGGCAAERQVPDSPQRRAAEEEVLRRWGKTLDELPVDELVAISPHNENIQNEFEWAFCLHRAVQRGRRVRISWRDVGGGASSIEKFLLNVFEQNRRRTMDIDVLWGGGEFTFMNLAKAGALEPLDLPADVIANVPEQFAGARMIDADRRWIGSAVSGFGFLYNRAMMERCGIAPPRQWEDLADRRFHGLISLADPSASGSAAMAYRMIVVSAPDWPTGWARLLRILANAGRFTDSAGAAANSPVLGEALLATSIDFYGAMRVAEAPDQLSYVSPPGQTTFSPDPIAVLHNPPHRELAEEFVRFVMSPQGQALWALPPGSPDGPIRTSLGRQPIRRDVYRTLAGRMLPWLVDPYQPGQALALDPSLDRGVDFHVLRALVYDAAIVHRDLLHRAGRRLIDSGDDPVLAAIFNELPPELSDLAGIRRAKADLGSKDSKAVDDLHRRWQRFFADKYRRILEAQP